MRRLTNHPLVKSIVFALLTTASGIVGGVVGSNITANNLIDRLYNQSPKAETLRSDVYFPSSNIVTEQFTAQPFMFVDQPEHAQADCKNVENLYTHGQRIDSNERIKAIKENLAYILTGSNGANALKIDESGYFLTVAHLLDGLDDPIQQVEFYVPSTGELLKAKDFLVDLERDIAIAYAPTGKISQGVKGIEFRKTPVELGLKMTAYAILPSTMSTVFNTYEIGTMEGEVVATYVTDRTIHGGIVTNFPKEQYKVEGMLSFHGASGMPAVDGDGRIVGVLTHLYPSSSELYGTRILNEPFGSYISPVDRGVESLLTICNKR